MPTTEQGSRLSWLTARAWLDEDGEHVWLRHECSNGWDESMLPHPTWQASEDGRTVEPSIDCGCGMHTFMLLERHRPEKAPDGE